MLKYRIISAVIGVLFGFVVFRMVRRDAMHVRHSPWWAGLAVMAVVLGVFPTIVDHVSKFLGVAYPPVLILVSGFCVVLMKQLLSDIELSRNEMITRRLVQRLAIVEEELRETRKELERSSSKD